MVFCFGLFVWGFLFVFVCVLVHCIVCSIFFPCVIFYRQLHLIFFVVVLAVTSFYAATALETWNDITLRQVFYHPAFLWGCSFNCMKILQFSLVWALCVWECALPAMCTVERARTHAIKAVPLRNTDKYWETWSFYQKSGLFISVFYYTSSYHK